MPQPHQDGRGRRQQHGGGDDGQVVPIRAAWATETPNDYDPHTHFTAATDAAGHSATLSSIAVPPEVHTRLRQLVESPAWPAYATVADVVRDAVVHRLHWISEHHPDPELRADLAAALREAAFTEVLSAASSVATRHMHLLTSFRAAAESFLAHRDMDGLAALCARTRDFAAEAREPYATALAQAVDLIERRAEQRPGEKPLD